MNDAIIELKQIKKIYKIDVVKTQTIIYPDFLINHSLFLSNFSGDKTGLYDSNLEKNTPGFEVSILISIVFIFLLMKRFLVGLNK